MPRPVRGASHNKQVVRYGLLCLALCIAIAGVAWAAWYSPWAEPAPNVTMRLLPSDSEAAPKPELSGR